MVSFALIAVALGLALWAATTLYRPADERYHDLAIMRLALSIACYMAALLLSHAGW